MVKVENVSCHIKDRLIIDSISFQIEAGDFLSVVGPNGAGKTTLIKAIAGGNNTLSSGNVYYNNNSIKNSTIDELARIRSVCSQKNNLSFAFKVKEVIDFGNYGKSSDGNNGDIQQVLKLFGIEDFSEREIQSLSGGEQQKVHIARALIQLYPNFQDKVLILDEPLIYLDYKFQKELLSILKGLTQKGLTIIAVLHDVNYAAHYSTKTLLVKEGTQFAFGKTKDIFIDDTMTNLFDIKMESIVNKKGQVFFV